MIHYGHDGRFQDTMQVCLNGHKITQYHISNPRLRRNFCEECGAETIHRCPNCQEGIKGKLWVRGGVASVYSVPVPKFCHKCGKPYPWSKSGKVEVIKASNPYELYKILDIHPEIKKVSEKLFRNGHYAEAIFASSKRIINLVKEKTGRPKDKKSGKELDGAKLMRKVFSVTHPKLKINELRTDTEKTEQQGFQSLFAGAVMGVRDPKAHSDITLDNLDKALEYIMFTSLLARKVDEAKRTEDEK